MSKGQKHGLVFSPNLFFIPSSAKQFKCLENTLFDPKPKICWETSHFIYHFILYSFKIHIVNYPNFMQTKIKDI